MSTRAGDLGKQLLPVVKESLANVKHSVGLDLGALTTEGRPE